MMMKYPVLEINTQIIRRNAEVLLNFCRDRGIEPYAVIKGFNAMDCIAKQFVEAGYKTLASSRLPHLVAAKKAGWPVKTLALRVPMLSETDEVVRWCDASLNSETQVLRALDEAAAKVNKIHANSSHSCRHNGSNARRYNNMPVCRNLTFSSSRLCSWYCDIAIFCDVSCADRFPRSR